MNKNFTFNSKEKNLIQPFKFIILYLISLYFNSETHDFFLEFDVIYLPFVTAALVSVAINFSGQKFWVFKKVK
jgi:putative flippase GtrA|tara:strand:+ start:2271 stop:2489 length:219 start_codon:yes stop_codon:yes gene_type:complete